MNIYLRFLICELNGQWKNVFSLGDKWLYSSSWKLFFWPLTFPSSHSSLVSSSLSFVFPFFFPLPLALFNIHPSPHPEPSPQSPLSPHTSLLSTHISSVLFCLAFFLISLLCQRRREEKKNVQGLGLEGRGQMLWVLLKGTSTRSLSPSTQLKANQPPPPFLPSRTSFSGVVSYVAFPSVDNLGGGGWVPE